MAWFIVQTSTGGEKVNEFIGNAFDIDSIRDAIDNRIINEIKTINFGDNYIHLWGLRKGENNIKYWNAFQRGDKVIFYSNGNYLYLGTISFKLHNYPLAKALWESDKEIDIVLEYLFFIVDVQKINIEEKSFNKMLGYNHNPRGFNPIKDKRVKMLRNNYGSVEKALESLMKDRRITSKQFDSIEVIEDSNFQLEIQNTTNPSPEEKDEPKERSHKSNHLISIRNRERDPSVSLHAIMEAGYKCEVDEEHFTFTSKATNKPYVEAHHLIPLHAQDFFTYSLDVSPNIVCLCPSCHRLLHHSIIEEKKTILMNIYTQRIERLINCKIDLSFEKLLDYYE